MIDVYKLFQIIIGILLIAFIIIPINVPIMVHNVYLLLILGVIIIVLFMVAHPILGVLSLLASYVLLQRTNTATTTILQTQEHKDDEFKQVIAKPNTENTLEQQVIDKLSPLASPFNNPSMFINTSFKPVNEPIGTASLI